jgi:transposase-like protein
MSDVPFKHGLPEPGGDVVRWTPQRKAAVVLAVQHGRLEAVAACRLYGVTDSELFGWMLAYQRYGVEGLKVTKTQRIGQ